MNTPKLISIICITGIAFLGCDRPERTVDHLRKDIAAFRATPDDTKSAAIEKDLAKLDSQILQLRTQGHIEKANLLQEQRDALAADFEAAKVYRTLQDAKSTLKGIQNNMQKSDEESGPSPASEASPPEASPSESSTPPVVPSDTTSPEAAPTEATTPESTPEASPMESPNTEAPTPEASPTPYNQ